MANKCPNCSKKLKGMMFNVGKTYTVRCECGTRITITQDFFTERILDWETQENRERSSRPL